MRRKSSSPSDPVYAAAVNEIAPGIWHWTAPHPAIRIRVSSYYLPAERVLIDPIAPEDGLDWFAAHGPPTDVLLTNRHHYRSSAQFAERFGVTVHCVRQGMHEFADGQRVEPFDFGAELPGGVVAYEVGRSVLTRRRCTSPPETRSHSPTARYVGSPAARSRSFPTPTWTRPSGRRRHCATPIAACRS